MRHNTYSPHLFFILLGQSGDKVKPKDMTDPHRYLNILKALPEEFTREQFKLEFMKYHNVSRTTITKRLETFVRAGFVEREKKDCYRKTDKMAQLEKEFIKDSMSEIRGGK